MKDEKVLETEFICTLNTFTDCSERGFDKLCRLDVSPKYSKATSSCKYRISAVEIIEEPKANVEYVNSNEVF